MTKLQLCGPTALCLSLAVASGPALAQTQGPADDAAEIEQEEIVVTAQKRTQDLIDVPQSVTVVNGLDAFPNGAIGTGVIRPGTFGLTVGTGF